MGINTGSSTKLCGSGLGSDWFKVKCGNKGRVTSIGVVWMVNLFSGGSGFGWNG